MVALEASGQIAPQRRTALRVGDRLVAGLEPAGDLSTRGAHEPRRAQQLAALGTVRAQSQLPHELAAGERPAPVDRVWGRITGAVIDRAEKEGAVRVRDVREVGRPPPGRELAHALRSSRERAGPDLVGAHLDVVGGQLELVPVGVLEVEGMDVPVVLEARLDPGLGQPLARAVELLAIDPEGDVRDPDIRHA